MQTSDLIKPLAIKTPIAVNGDKNIPSQNASGGDTSSINLGFLPITQEQLPPDGNGIAPERTDFNGMFYLATDLRVFLQNGGFITYDANVASAIGGYPQDAILGYIDSDHHIGFVQSCINHNSQNFVTNPSLINGSIWRYAHINNTDSEFSAVRSSITSVQNYLQGQITTNANDIISVSNRTTTAQNTANNAQTTANSKISSTLNKTNKTCRLSNGFIVQWGVYNVSASATNRSTAVITLPISYTDSSSYRAIVTPNTNGANDASVDWDELGITGQTASNFTLRFAANKYNKSINWVTIGY